MTDTPDAPATPQPEGQATQQPKVTQRVVAQYIRDMSFENALAQKGLSGDLQPEVSVQVNLDARKRGQEGQYEVITKLNITSKAKESGDPLFIFEIEYAGVFQISGVPDDQLHPYLLIECPRITFPYLRRIVSDVTRDGGFPPLNLEQIDFLQLYRNELQRRAQAQQAQKAAEAEPGPSGTA
ncbi:protein-export chaperone SecB [Limimaricola hongkongensis]|uniref:Protein-export protein SecB n=1 Tax=Limimaricola hongkongensis DSM 17492 TaxID=1122180 RepID=A0A017HFT9_9RHOB|nr:protein-export chaperone SecB [Limimaricola hongkongensis]EYD73170.1 Protein export cytoplasm chaperone protein [Limimaricola hongkongensis DSM 17492]